MVVAQAIIRLRAPGEAPRFRFQRVTDRAGLAEVGAFRLAHYGRCGLPYLLEELDRNGLDEFDRRAHVYAAWFEGRMVSTVRAVPPPFELDRWVSRADLAQTVGSCDLERCVEVSRMLVEPEFASRGLGSAMIGFGGMDLLLTTSSRGYLAYVRDRSSGAVALPLDARRAFRFRIPQRGEHEYTIVSGTIGADSLWRGIGKVRRAARKRLPHPRVEEALG